MVTSSLQAIDRLVSDGRRGAVVTIIDGPDIGSFAVIDGASGSREIDATWLDDPLMADVVALMAREESLAITHGDRRLFVDVVAPPPTMLIFGAGHVAQMLAPMAQSAGFRVVVSDARSDWITHERFPGIDRRSTPKLEPQCRPAGFRLIVPGPPAPHRPGEPDTEPPRSSRLLRPLGPFHQPWRRTE